MTKVLIHKPRKSDKVKKVIMFFIGKTFIKVAVNPIPNNIPRGIKRNVFKDGTKFPSRYIRNRFTESNKTQNNLVLKLIFIVVLFKNSQNIKFNRIIKSYNSI